MTQFVKTRRDGAVLVVTLDRPDKKNALTGAMYDALTLALSVANDEPGVGSVLFLGSGGCFTAGNDIADFLAFATNAQIRGAGESPALRFIRALAAAQKPMVASVDGVAIGIGTTLILHCDYVLASPRTVFQTPFVDLGLVPEAGSSLLLPLRIGPARAAEMILFGEKVDGETAARIGLVNELHDSEGMDTRALERARALAARPRAAMLAARKLLHGDKARVLARIEEESKMFNEALHSEEARAAFMAFMAKPKR
jgi:enoyl-CoA hydratase/carnithine racemase